MILEIEQYNHREKRFNANGFPYYVMTHKVPENVEEATEMVYRRQAKLVDSVGNTWGRLYYVLKDGKFVFAGGNPDSSG